MLVHLTHCFHDLRHSTPALLLRTGVPLVAVRKVLQHEDSKLTEVSYGHVEQDFLIDSVDRLRFDRRPEAKPVRARRGWRPWDPNETRSPGNKELRFKSNSTFTSLASLHRMVLAEPLQMLTP